MNDHRCVRIPIRATAREPIKQAGYMLATTKFPVEISLATRSRSIHVGHKRPQHLPNSTSAFSLKPEIHFNQQYPQ